MAYDFPASPTTGQIYQGWTYDGEKWVAQGAAAAAPLRSYLAGLTLSTAGSSATFGIAAGIATDSTNVASLALASAYTKTTGAWAVGSGVGALDTGTIGAASWYHVYLIRRPDTGVVDVLMSLSATAPTLPASYTQFRRIGSMKTAASLWVKFSQSGDEFLLDATVNDVTGTSNLSTTATFFALSVPVGVQVNALFRSAISGTVNIAALVNSPDQAVETAGSPAANYQMMVPAAGSAATSALNIRTNTAAQIRAVASGAINFYVNTYGWIDRRGRDA